MDKRRHKGAASGANSGRDSPGTLNPPFPSLNLSNSLNSRQKAGVHMERASSSNIQDKYSRRKCSW